MIDLLAYGSLMHPDELSRHVAHEPAVVPVRVSGYRRSFCQEPSWRRGRGARRGVLTVRASAEDWINAVLVRGCDGEVLRALDHRERGYERVSVPIPMIEPYVDPAGLDDVSEAHIFRGRPEKWNADLSPNPEYVERCVEAAGRWGSEFLRDFLRTTYAGEVDLGSWRDRG